MSISPADLTYPTLCLSGQAGLTVAEHPDSLERCRAGLFWKARFYEGLLVVDATGSAYEVAQAEVRRPGSPLARRVARLLDLSLSIQVTLRFVGQALFDELRERVLAEIDDDPETLEEMTGRDVFWWRAALARCTTARELVQTLQTGVYQAG